MNSPMAVLAPAGTADVVASAAQVVSSWGFAITPDTLNQIASEVGEQSIISRAGGAPTLAVGMAYILHGALGGMMDVAFWYHFAILFEALFILTAVDAGTRAARFMLQDLLGVVSPGLKRTDSLPANLLATALCVLAWGYFLHQGVVDPLGGINTLCIAVWYCQPDAGRDGADALCCGAVQNETSTLRLGGAGTNGLAADLYPDRRLAESV